VWIHGRFFSVVSLKTELLYLYLAGGCVVYMDILFFASFLPLVTKRYFDDLVRVSRVRLDEPHVAERFESR